MRSSDAQRVNIILIDLFIVLISIFISSLLPYADMDRITFFALIVTHWIVISNLNFYGRIGFRGCLEELFIILKYSGGFLLLLTFFYTVCLDSPIISRRGIFYFIVINGVLLYLSHSIIHAFWSKILGHTKLNNQVILVTTQDRASNIITTLHNSSTWMGKVAAVVLLDETDQERVCEIEGYRVIAKNQLLDYLTGSVVDHAFIHAASGTYHLSELLSIFGSVGIDTSVNINFPDFDINGEKQIQKISSYSVMTFSTKFYKPTHLFLKRLIDIVGALIGLIICGLVAIVIVPLIKADGGPAFFSQDRVGRNGRVFKFYKFRSMREDAEEVKQKLMEQNTMSGPMFKVDDDPRVTPIGRFIRKTSLDELPQFFNVLIGNMSLVGTRPPTYEEYIEYTPEQKRRLSFKPGITGLWQISGRSNINNFDEIVKLDVSYIDNWSVWSDIKILLKTIKVVITGRGAK